MSALVRLGTGFNSSMGLHSGVNMSSNNNWTVHDRYYNDPQFHALVDMMVSHIINCKYTPSEMREAAILASIKYEQRFGRSSVMWEQVLEVMGNYNEKSTK